MIAKLQADIRELKRKVEALQPRQSPGIMTQRTTRGTFRKGVVQGTQAAKVDTVPRWG